MSSSSPLLLSLLFRTSVDDTHARTDGRTHDTVQLTTIHWLPSSSSSSAPPPAAGGQTGHLGDGGDHRRRRTKRWIKMPFCSKNGQNRRRIELRNQSLKERTELIFNSILIWFNCNLLVTVKDTIYIEGKHTRFDLHRNEFSCSDINQKQDKCFYLFFKRWWSRRRRRCAGPCLVSVY